MAEINFQEKELEDFLCDGGRKGNLLKYLGLELIARQFQIDNNFIDILAYSKYDKSFVIIELKRNNLDYNAYFQCLKYIQKFKHKYYKFNVIGLLIGQKLSNELEDIIYFINPKTNTIKDVKNISTIFYNLFNLDFKNGISFNYYNVNQYNIQRNKWKLIK